MPFGGLLAGSVAAPILGGVIGNAMAGGDSDAARAAYEQGLQAISAVQLPSAAELQIALDKYKLEGTITPELQQVFQLAPSQMSDISVDPRLRQAQMQALGTLQKLGATGLDATDRMALTQIKTQVDTDTRAKQQAVMQNMQERGISGSGSELAQQLMAAQGGAQSQQQQGLNVASQAQQRALQAISQAGGLGGQMENTQFGEEAQKAKAADIVNQYNTQNRQNIQGQNVGTQNQSQYYNLGQKQQISNANVDTQHQQEIANQQAKIQAANMALQKAGMMAGQYGNIGQFNSGQAAQTRGMWSGIGQGVGSGLGTMGAYSAMSNKFGATPAPSAPGVQQSAGQDMLDSMYGGK